MEEKFKKLLEKSKALESQALFRTFEGALFRESSWFFHFLDHPPKPGALPLQSADSAVLSAPLSSSTHISPDVAEASLPEVYLEALCLVVFVGDTYKGEGEDLLGKMIAAMQLKQGEYYRFPHELNLESIEDLSANLKSPGAETLKLLDFILEKRPRFVVSLGATVTNVLLGRREKLSGIRGQFYQKVVGSFKFEFIPVFHPDFLMINPNMKRAAWGDLQKIMARVGKI